MTNKIKLSIIGMALSAFMVSCSSVETEVSNEVEHNAETIIEEVVAIPTIAQDVEAKEFQELFETGNGTLVDVRTPGEVINGSIEGSVNIDFNGGEFEAEIAKLDKEQPVYVYCAAGGRSGKAMSMMKDMGFTEVYNLIGGYGNWPFK